MLEEMVRQYRKRNGVMPRNFVDLVAAGWLRRLPVDPIGNPYKLMPDGRVEVAEPDPLPFITKGLPPGREPSIFDEYGAKQYQEKYKDDPSTKKLYRKPQ